MGAIAACAPADLTELHQWVNWSRERGTKVPRQPDGQYASSTDPLTWNSYEDVLDAARDRKKGFAGIGFVFCEADPYCGIDLDDCLDDAGQVRPWARGVVERFSDTYMEVSPSGHGLKCWARGSLPANLPKVSIENGGIELYDHARYFTVTGRVFRGAPLAVEDHAADLLGLYECLRGNRRSNREWRLQPLQGGRIPYGQQHSTLVSIAGTLKARRVCDEAIEACLQIINERQCERPGARENISRIIRSTRRWGATA